MPLTAPYRFARIPRWVHMPNWGALVSQDVPFSDGLSGEVPLTITAETAICVGGSRRRDEEGRTEVFPFRLPDGAYAIPASTLQGMCRSILEVVAFGRLGNFVEERWFGLRSFGARPSATVDQHYSKRIIDYDNKTRVVKPKVQTGWLIRTQDGACLQACRLSRVHINHLIQAYSSTNNRQRHTDELNLRKGGNTASERYRLLLGLCDGSNQDLNLDALERNFMIEKPEYHDHASFGGSIYESYCTFADNGTAGTIVLTGKPQTGGDPFGKHKKKREFVFHSPSRRQVLSGLKGTDIIPEAPLDSKVMEAFLAINENGKGEPVTDAWAFWRREYMEHRPVPVFWIGNLEKENGVAIAKPEALSLAYGMKLPFPASTHDLLANSSPDHLDVDGPPDLPSLIFGKAAKIDTQGETSGFGRRAWFEVAHGPRESNLKRHELTLLSPRPSFYPSYVRQMSKAGSDQVEDGPMAVYANASEKAESDNVWCDRPELGGVKLYPVARQSTPRRAPEAPNNLETENTKTRTNIWALPAKTTFQTTLHFHNLRPAELGAVLWALSFGKTGSDNAGQLHHLGMANSSGFGEVQINIGAPSFLGINDETADYYVEFFESYMGTLYEAEGRARGLEDLKWSESPQVLAVREAANPQGNHRNGLARMSLAEFTEAKQDQRFLMRYVTEAQELPRRVQTPEHPNAALKEEGDTGKSLGQRVRVRHTPKYPAAVGKEGIITGYLSGLAKPFEITLPNKTVLKLKENQFEFIDE